MPEESGGDDNVFQIVDGQQRLTTSTILLCAIRDMARQYVDRMSTPWFASVDRTTESKEAAQRTIDYARQAIVLSGEPDHYYLTINQKDQSLFRDKVQKEQELSSPESPEMVVKSNESRITKSWKLIVKKIFEDFLGSSDGIVKLKEFVSFCLKRIIFLQIRVDDDVDAYLLFESLNDRGLELSIADLVKNRLMIVASPHEDKVNRVVAEWEGMLRDLEASRFGVKDYLRFYWSAFVTPCTSRQLYSNIKRHLTASNVESEIAHWRSAVGFFLKLTARDLQFPNSAHGYGTIESLHAQLATLRYSVCLPFLLAVNSKRQSLNEAAAKMSLVYLFRVVSIADMSAGKADGVFRACVQALKDGKSDEDVLKPLREAAEANDESFIRNLTTRTFEDNAIVKYLLTCIHLHDLGGGATPDSTIELEHILPQNESAWSSFDDQGKKRAEWIYRIGNATLLEQKVNAAVRDNEFAVKVARYRQRTDSEDFSTATAIPMTYELHTQFINEVGGGPLRAWTAQRITERTQHFANKAAVIFSLERGVATIAGRRKQAAKRSRRSGSSGAG
jgi:hypothetical protein